MVCHWRPMCCMAEDLHFVVIIETCERCGYMSSNALCKACTLLEGLERGMANAGIVSFLFQWLASLLSLTMLEQTDRARKKLEADGPAPDNIRTIPFFERAPSGTAAISIETPS